MTDISLKIRAEELGKSLDGLSDDLELEIQDAVQNLAESAYSYIISEVQQKLKTTRMDYLKNLTFERLDDSSWLISLEGTWPNMVEDGFTGYDLKETLLKSNKVVQVGSRAGENWVRINQDGQKYAAVPFQEKQADMPSDLAQAMKSMSAKNAQGRKQKITKLFKGKEGQPLEGKVATAKSDNSLLDAMVKYQYRNESGTMSSIYMNYRMISENSDGWQHPGWAGCHFFQAAEQWIEAEMDNIIKILL
jgi:hypothetical protein